MMFKPGDTVKCVNDGVVQGIDNVYPSLRNGNIYTVERQISSSNVRVHGFPSGLFPERFELYSKEDNVRLLLNKIDEI